MFTLAFTLSIPALFLIIAITFFVVFIIYSEWQSRR